MNESLFGAIEELVQALVDHRYDELERDGRAGEGGAAGLRHAIAEYGRTLVPLRDEARHLVEVYQSADDDSESSVDVPLWTAEEGRSDLTLSIAVHRQGSKVVLSIEDIHVP